MTWDNITTIAATPTTSSIFSCSKSLSFSLTCLMKIREYFLSIRHELLHFSIHFRNLISPLRFTRRLFPLELLSVEVRDFHEFSNYYDGLWLRKGIEEKLGFSNVHHSVGAHRRCRTFPSFVDFPFTLFGKWYLLEILILRIVSKRWHPTWHKLMISFSFSVCLSLDVWLRNNIFVNVLNV